MNIAPSCFSCQAASNDISFDLETSISKFDLRSRSWPDPNWSYYISIDSSDSRTVVNCKKPSLRAELKLSPWDDTELVPVGSADVSWCRTLCSFSSGCSETWVMLHPPIYSVSPTCKQLISKHSSTKLSHHMRGCILCFGKRPFPFKNTSKKSNLKVIGGDNPSSFRIEEDLPPVVEHLQTAKTLELSVIMLVK